MTQTLKHSVEERKALPNSRQQYFEESEKMDSNMEIKSFRTHVHIT